MKTKIKVTLTVVAITLLFSLSYKVIITIQEKSNMVNDINTMPKFSFITIDNSIFSNNNLKSTSSTVFIYFSSECDFCQYEAQSIKNSIEDFKNVQLIFVSSEPVNKIRQFVDQHELNNYQNIIFLHDHLSVFSNQFKARSIPYVLVYNENQRLIKAHKGQLNAKGILKFLNK